MVGEVVVRDGDGSGPHDGVNQAIRAAGERAVVNPHVAGTEDGDGITVSDGPPPIVGWGAADHRIAGGLAVVDVEAMNDDVGDVLDGYTCAIGNVDIVTTAIDGLETVHNQLLLQGDHHITLEHDPQGPLLDNCVTEGARSWVHRVMITRISDHVEAAIATPNGITSEADPAISQPLAVAVPIGVASPAVVDGIAGAAGKEAQVPSLSAVPYSHLHRRGDLFWIIGKWNPKPRNGSPPASKEKKITNGNPFLGLGFHFPCPRSPLPTMDLDLNAPHAMGTTIIGVTYDGGVVLGADSRTSTGMYVANRASDKITQLTDNVYVCRSGSAADSQVVSDYVRYFLHQHTIQLGQPATVKVAANLVRLLSYNNKNMLQTGLIIGGWDKYEGGQIYSVPLGGTILEQPFTIGGSGSSYLYGFFDQEWKEGMSKDEAEKLVVKAVSLAIARDGASGGVVRTVIINSEGVTRNFYPGDTLPLWHEELEPRNSLLDIVSSASPEPMSI